MEQRYYIDTSIWVDLYDDRKGYLGEPLGDFALSLFSLLKGKGFRLVITDCLIKELEQVYSIAQINGMIKPFEGVTEKIMATEEQKKEAMVVSKTRNVPAGDALHAIIARDSNLILVTRDRHFRKLRDISPNYKPEELI
ncbi:type II toxin-antitoxin system VapC family toxin [Candidatus Woesearchaeota archaeon]|nr:type II toxin-antitoxin system VapC family toxin [Candidatus Woesearchaeota archaeon]